MHSRLPRLRLPDAPGRWERRTVGRPRRRLRPCQVGGNVAKQAILGAGPALSRYLEAARLISAELPVLGAEIAVEVAELLSELLCSSLADPARRAFGEKIRACVYPFRVPLALPGLYPRYTPPTPLALSLRCALMCLAQVGLPRR